MGEITDKERGFSRIKPEFTKPGFFKKAAFLIYANSRLISKWSEKPLQHRRMDVDYTVNNAINFCCC